MVGLAQEAKMPRARTTQDPNHEARGHGENASVRVIFTKYRSYLLAPDEQGVPVEQYF
jgi:hypothetical protein